MSRDLVVVGGGPAGLALALAARRHDLAVTVLERRRPPLDKACGEGIMPAGLMVLAELGVRLDPPGARPFRGIRYVNGDVVAEGDFPGGRHGLGMRRTALQAALAAAAEAAGAELRWGVEVTGLSPGGVETSAGPVAGRVVAGADGLRSPLRAWAGLAGPPARRRRFGVRRHYRLAPWTDRVEVHWGDGCEGYVTPVGEQEVGVALLAADGGRFDALLARLPALARRLAGAATVSRDLGAGPFEQRVRGVVAGRVALVGDAAGYLDAITGEGLALAFGSALDLATAVANDDLGGYARAHRRRTSRPLAVTRLALFAQARPALRRRLVRALAGDPELFSRLLGVLDGALPPVGLGPLRALRFLGRLAHA